MSRKKETITLSIPSGTREKLEEIARQFNIYWGKSPSPSGLIAAIASGHIKVGQPFTLSTKQVDTFEQIVDILIKSGYIREAQTLSALLSERGKLETLKKASLLQKVSQYDKAWRILAEQYIDERQPFQILYRNTQEKEFLYTVRCAKISFYEKHFYLNIWCEETDYIDDISEQNRQDFPELVHNRCLRMDRIKAIARFDGHWRDQLDFIEVQLQFKRGMVKAYEAREDDINNEIVDGTRIVTRKVSNPFWFIREVRHYSSDDCNVITPEAICQRIRQELIKDCQQYGLEIVTEK